LATFVDKGYHRVIMPITVIVAEDHTIFRQGLRALIKNEADLKLVGDVEDGRTAVRLTQELIPDVVVMDVRMPGLNGLDASRQIKTSNPAVKIVILSANLEPDLATQLLNAGVSALLPKESAYEELSLAIRTVVSGQMYISPRIADRVVGRLLHSSDGDNGSVFLVLTPRERQVLQLIAEGRATKEIAGDLSLSVKTIETHRRQLMDKLNLYSVAELTRYAVRGGLVAP
jgi:DNA-binding NarL/FixJ family response regulator